MTIERYPLTWPTGQPRMPLHRRSDAAFKVDFGRSRDELLHSLELLGGRNVILSSNVPLRQDGLPYANMPEPADPGVAVYFDRLIAQDAKPFITKPFVIACDSYRRVRWNLRAIGAAVDALRTIQRHGASAMLEQAFTGFAALPPAEYEPPWWEVLGVAETASEDVVRRAYLDLVKIHHPDVGGSLDTMSRINRARAVALSRNGVRP